MRTSPISLHCATRSFRRLSPFLHVNLTKSLTIRKKWFRSAKFLNAYGIGIALGLCVAVAIPAGLSTSRFVRALDAYRRIDAGFAQEQAAWNGTLSTALLDQGAHDAGIMLAGLSEFMK